MLTQPSAAGPGGTITQATRYVTTNGTMAVTNIRKMAASLRKFGSIPNNSPSPPNKPDRYLSVDDRNRCLNSVAPTVKSSAEKPSFRSLRGVIRRDERNLGQQLKRIRGLTPLTPTATCFRRVRGWPITHVAAEPRQQVAVGVSPRIASRAPKSRFPFRTASREDGDSAMGLAITCCNRVRPCRRGRGYQRAQ